MRVSAISGSMGIYGLGNNYRVSSIQGNPYSMSRIRKIGDNAAQAGKPLVIASEEPEKDLYVKDFGALDSVKSTATGDFAEILGVQEELMSDGGAARGQQAYTDYLNDTIGAMGYRNQLRDMLNGVGFTPFA
ncbi:MAG: hypothetical protein NC337_04695 [Roseburia sp.]|nr:hypothetical protein [Roseburia sp.]